MVNRESERKRLTTDKKKIFVRENPTLMSITKDELRKLYNEIFDRLQEYEVAEETGQIVVPPVEVGQILYVIEAGLIFEAKVKEYKYCSNSANGIHWHIIFEELFAISEAHIGKTVFTSREDAVKALKGAEGK